MVETVGIILQIKIQQSFHLRRIGLQHQANVVFGIGVVQSFAVELQAGFIAGMARRIEQFAYPKQVLTFDSACLCHGLYGQRIAFQGEHLQFVITVYGQQHFGGVVRENESTSSVGHLYVVGQLRGRPVNGEPAVQTGDEFGIFAFCPFLNHEVCSTQVLA